MKQFQPQRHLLPTLVLMLGLCTSVPVFAASADDDLFVPEDSGVDTSIADPLESLNRATFAFNDKAYRYVMKPVARGLRVLPEPVRTSFSNFFSNLNSPISAISALLQGEPRNAATELGRFVVNTTVGVLGLFDPATSAGLIEDEEDLGQTMARYGVGHGFYLVVPLYGSSSLRDAIGSVATSALNPVYLNLETGEVLGIRLASAEISLSLDKDTYEAFYDSALDPYVFFRSAWVQNRQGKVNQ